MTLPPGGVFDDAVPEDANACVYVFVGGARVGDPDHGDVAALNAKTVAVLGEGDRVRVEAGAEGARFLLLAGRPINEPVAWGGPFVMNTREEVLQAFKDYQEGRLA